MTTKSHVVRSGFSALAMDSDEETAAQQYAYSSDEDDGRDIHFEPGGSQGIQTRPAR